MGLLSYFNGCAQIKNPNPSQRTLSYFVRGNNTVQLTSCLIGLDSAVLLNWNYKQICLFGQILTGQRGGQLYSDISPYKVTECSLRQSLFRPISFSSQQFLIEAISGLSGNQTLLVVEDGWRADHWTTSPIKAKCFSDDTTYHFLSVN